MRSRLAFAGVVIGAFMLLGTGCTPGFRRALRIQFSCRLMVEDLSNLPIPDDATTLTCHKPIWGITWIRLQLSDSAFNGVAKIAANRKEYHRTEAVPDSLTGSWWKEMRQRHGWYSTDFGQNANGGFSVAILDESAKTIYVEYSPN